MTAPAAAPRAGGRRALADACECHFCSHVLPAGRAVTFCPNCGQNVTVRQCPACSAEVDAGWSFCVCCGRGMSG